MRRYIKYLLIFALLVFLTVPAAVAANVPIVPIEPVTQVAVNDPVANSFVVEEIVVEPVQEATPQTYHETIEDAAAELRQRMVNREMEIAVGLKWNSNDSTLMRQILNEAFRHTGAPKEGDYLLKHYGGCRMRLAGYSNGRDYYLTITYSITRYYTDAQQEAEVDAAVANLLEELNVRERSDYEKVKAVYDYICTHVTYDYAGLSGEDFTTYSAYKALIKGTSVCQGYANLFYRLCLELGVDNRIISGVGNGGRHGWNIVKLNGLYYNLDATWDSSRAEMGWDYDYFLRSPDNFDDHARDAEFETEEFHAQYPMGRQDFNASDIFTFEIKDNVAVITGHIGTDKVVAVPAQIAGFPVGKLGQRAFFAQREITSVILPDSITEIGEDAFCGCGKLTSVNMPASLQTVGPSAFKNCRGLTSVKLPDGVTSIGESAFENCENITELKLPSRLARIGFGVFRNCVGLTSVVLPDTVEYLGGSAFEKCTALSQINIPDGITAIKGSTFKECGSLGNLVLPASVTVIENAAFQYCSNLTIPDLSNVTSIGEDAFESCVKLQGLSLSPQLTLLGPDAFFNCQSITQAVVPSGITRLEMGVFAGCSNLQLLVLPDNMTEIGHMALADCSALTSLELPSGLTVIEPTAFHSAGFTDIEIPEGITELPWYVFENCVNLKTVVIPVSMTQIESDAFRSCTNLTTVYYNGTREQWDAISIISYGNETLLSAQLICADDSSEALGDMNGNGVVDDADALYLLRHTLFASRYPVRADADVNSDGAVTDGDALYLLRHTLFPARYPLYPAA